MSGYIGNIPTLQATQTRQDFTATASQTTFATAGYTPSFLDVFLNGVHLVNGTDYTASNGSDVVLTSGAAAGDTLEVVAYSTFEASDVTASSGFTVTGNLSVDGGTIKLDGAYPVGSNNVAFGNDAFANNVSGAQNTALGERALNASTTTSWNTAVGYKSSFSNTSGTNLTSVGSESLISNTTGSNNTALGTNSLYFNISGSSNTGVGASALQLNTTGASNTAVGRETLYNNTTGQNNSALGFQALSSNTTGQYNIAVGSRALASNATASNNTAVGYYAGYSKNADIGSTFLGYSAGYNNTSGSYNTFVGADSGYMVTTGAKNTILGVYNGNQGGLDIRTSNNQIVLSDGDGNPRGYYGGHGGNSTWDFTTPTNNQAAFIIRHSGTSPTGLACSFSGASPNNTSQSFLSCGDPSVFRMFIWSNGDLANRNNVYGAISDEKLKENIVDSGSQWDDIKALRIRKYSLKEQASDVPTQLGVIAQEVEAAGMGGLVTDTPDLDPQTREDLGTITKQVNYSVLYIKAVKALQEAMERIEQLEADVAALKNP